VQDFNVDGVLKLIGKYRVKIFLGLLEEIAFEDVDVFDGAVATSRTSASSSGAFTASRRRT
jgi:hypothetical protein